MNSIENNPRHSRGQGPAWQFGVIQSFITEQDKGYLVYNGKTDFYNDQIQLQSFTDFLQQ